MKTQKSLFRSLAALGLLLTLPTTALAAGYDTPMLYSARHMGMGGTAIGYVDDPSAIFHNPAGLSLVKGGALMGDFSPLVGTIHGSPSGHQITRDGKSESPALNIDSNTTFAPFFLAGAAYKLHKFATLGFAVYPVASAGASYTYAVEVTDDKGNVSIQDIEDKTRLVFLDFAPGISAELAPGLRLGVAYRFSTVEFERVRKHPNATGTPLTVDLTMKGNNPAGFRAGLQYTAGDFDFGLVYRHRTDTTVKTANGTLESNTGKDITYEFILPTKFGLGVHYRGIKSLRLALDAEYTLQSENQTTYLAGTGVLDVGGFKTEFPVKVPNEAQWDDNITARLGAAYQLGAAEVRAGYTFDAKAANVRYPSAFGTPPGATHVATVGVGYEILPDLDVSLAGAYRTGSATVTAEDVKDNKCPFCGKQGDYKIDLFGGYVDVRWRFGGEKAPAPAAPEGPATPVAETPKTEPAAAETPKTEPAAAETPKAEPAPAEAPAEATPPPNR